MARSFINSLLRTALVFTTDILFDMTLAKFLDIDAVEPTTPAPAAIKNLTSMSQKIFPSHAVKMLGPPQINALIKVKMLKRVIQTMRHIAEVLRLRMCHARGINAAAIDIPHSTVKRVVRVIVESLSKRHQRQGGIVSLNDGTEAAALRKRNSSRLFLVYILSARSSIEIRHLLNSMCLASN